MDTNRTALDNHAKIVAEHRHDWRVCPSERHAGRFLVIDWTTGVVAEDNLSADGASLSLRIRTNPLGAYGIGC